MAKRRSKSGKAKSEAEATEPEAAVLTDLETGEVVEAPPESIPGKPMDPLNADPGPMPLGMLGGAPAPEPKAATSDKPLPSVSSGVVMGPAAVDPTRRRRSKPFPITCPIYCGVSGIRAEHAAGFITWATNKGHAEATRSEWDALYETYKNTPVLT